MRTDDDARELLERALEEWRRTRNPLLADAIDVLDRETIDGYSPPKIRAQDVEGWIDAAQRADVVAASWFFVSIFTTWKPIEAWVQSLRAIRRFSDDPRFTAHLVEVFSSLAVPGDAPAYAPIAEALAATRDVRAIGRLEALLVEPKVTNVTKREVVRALLPRVIDALAAVRPQPIADAELWRSIAAPETGLSPPDATEVALLEAIFQSPNDDHLRAIYADALTARGDPRGEFITLQLSAADDPGKRRERALRLRYQSRWLQGLETVLQNVVFRRGFPETADVVIRRANSATPDLRLKTLRRLGSVDQNPELLIPLIEAGVLTGLEEAQLPSWDRIDLLAHLPAVTHLVLPVAATPSRLEMLTRINRTFIALTLQPTSSERFEPWVDGLIHNRLLVSLQRLHLRIDVEEEDRPDRLILSALLAERLWNGPLEWLTFDTLWLHRVSPDQFELELESYRVPIVLELLRKTFLPIRTITIRESSRVFAPDTNELVALARQKNVSVSFQ